jgi:hypothetical protein
MFIKLMQICFGTVYVVEFKLMLMYLILSTSVAFLHQRDEKTCYEVAHILTLLLFDEVAKFDLG